MDFRLRPALFIFTLILVAVVGVATLSWAAPDEEFEAATSTLASKIVKGRSQKMEAFCILEQRVENCGNLGLGPVEFTTGPEAGQVAVVRFTVQYRTSRGDAGKLTASLGPMGEDREQMSPGAYLIPTSPARSTATVTWVGENLDPSTTYGVSLSAGSVRREGAESELIHLTSVAEVELTAP